MEREALGAILSSVVAWKSVPGFSEFMMPTRPPREEDVRGVELSRGEGRVPHSAPAVSPALVFVHVTGPPGVR